MPVDRYPRRSCASLTDTYTRSLRSWSSSENPLKTLHALEAGASPLGINADESVHRVRHRGVEAVHVDAGMLDPQVLLVPDFERRPDAEEPLWTCDRRHRPGQAVDLGSPPPLDRLQVVGIVPHVLRDPPPEVPSLVVEGRAVRERAEGVRQVPRDDVAVRQVQPRRVGCELGGGQSVRRQPEVHSVAVGFADVPHPHGVSAAREVDFGDSEGAGQRAVRRESSGEAGLQAPRIARSHAQGEFSVDARRIHADPAEETEAAEVPFALRGPGASRRASPAPAAVRDG